MALKNLAACLGIGMLFLQTASGWAAQPVAHDATNPAVHATRAASITTHEIASPGKNSRKPRPAAQSNRGPLVSVGPQAMTYQRIRDIAMAPTG